MGERNVLSVCASSNNSEYDRVRHHNALVVVEVEEAGDEK